MPVRLQVRNKLTTCSKWLLIISDCRRQTLIWSLGYYRFDASAKAWRFTMRRISASRARVIPLSKVVWRRSADAGNVIDLFYSAHAGSTVIQALREKRMPLCARAGVVVARVSQRLIFASTRAGALIPPDGR